MKKGQKYTCVYTSGGGTDYPEGQWIIKTLTEKTMIIEKISEQKIYGNYEKGDKIKCLLSNHNNAGKGWTNPLRDWGDGTFTIYPQQGGTPYNFEPMNKERNDERK